MYLKEQLMDKRLFELEYLADTFLKMNKYSCYLKENNWQNLLPTIKSKLKKLEFWKTYWSLELEGFPLLKNYSDEINSDINKCDSPYIIHMEGLNDFEPIFQVANALYYQINCGTHLEPTVGIKIILGWRHLRFKRCRKKPSGSFPYLTKKQQLLGSKAIINSFSRQICSWERMLIKSTLNYQGRFVALKETEKPLITIQTNITNS